jgi:methionyl-tRNA formyltransferase
MKKRKILTDPNPILRQETQMVETFDGQLQELIDDLIYTMRSSDGIGLAAPQIGEVKKIIVLEYNNKDDQESSFPLTVIVNPKIVEVSDEQEFAIEGCLSFPGKELYIKRSLAITVTGLDRWGKPITVRAKKLFSQALQHEIDHINGILMIDHIKVAKTIFIGNGTLGLPTIKMICQNPQYSLIAVITSVDQLAGRQRVMTQTPVAEIAQELELRVLKVRSVNEQSLINKIKKITPDLIVLADYREIIPKNIFEIPKFGVLNIHPSILPKYRGPSPVISAILNGDKKTGVSVIKINEGVDTGDILAQIETKIRSRENTILLKERLAEIGADLLAELIPYYIAGEIAPIKQKSDSASGTIKLSKDQGRLTGKEDPLTIDRMVRALNPWPGVYLIKNNKRIYITKAHINKDRKLVIDTVKPEGKKVMDYQDYLRGYKEELTFGQ